MTIFDLIRVMYYQKYIENVQQITNYQPYNEQEAKDKELLLKVLKQKECSYKRKMK